MFTSSMCVCWDFQFDFRYSDLGMVRLDNLSTEIAFGLNQNGELNSFLLKKPMSCGSFDISEFKKLKDSSFKDYGLKEYFTLCSKKWLPNCPK